MHSRTLAHTHTDTCTYIYAHMHIDIHTDACIPEHADAYLYINTHP